MNDALTAWHVPPEPVRLVDDEVHVWRVELEPPPPKVETFWRVLSEDERRRAESFRFERDRTRFVVARGALRNILSRYLLCRPGLICFEYGPQGKPAVRETTGAPALEFNVSHSGGLALCAVGAGRGVGCDIEYMREDLADEQIARQFFSEREVAALLSLSPAVRARAFFNCWTRKEAYIKATGRGLSQSLSSFAVSLDLETRPALLWVEGDEAETQRWTIKDLSLDPGYTAAVVAAGSDWRLECWQWAE